MKEELNFVLNENEVMSSQLEKEKVFCDSIKIETKKSKASLEELKNNIKNIKKAVLIRAKEVSKHKLNLKKGEMKMKGVISSLSKTFMHLTN